MVRWLHDFISWSGLPAISVDAWVDETVVAGDSSFEGGWRHGNSLEFHRDLRCKFGDRVGGKEKALGAINVRRFGGPALAFGGRGVEDGPDRTAPVVAIADTGQCGVHPIEGSVYDVLRISVIAIAVILDLLVIIRCEVTVGFVEEALSKHIDGDDVLPVVYLQAGGAGLVEDGTAGLPVTTVIILVADGEGFGQVQAELSSLVIEAPK